MSDNRINTLSRIDQSIRGLNEDAHDDAYIPAQSENGALERINKSIQNLDIKGIKSGLPKVTNKDNGKLLKVINGKWNKGEAEAGLGVVKVSGTSYAFRYDEFSRDEENLYLVNDTVLLGAQLSKRYIVTSDAQETDLVSASNNITNHEPWRILHAGDSNGWTSEDAEGSYIQYDFDGGAAITQIKLTIKCAKLDESGSSWTKNVKIGYKYSYDEGQTWLPEGDPENIIERSFMDVSPSGIIGKAVSPGLIGGRTITNIRIYNQTKLMDSSDNSLITLHDLLLYGVREISDNCDSIWYKGKPYSEEPDIFVINGTADADTELPATFGHVHLNRTFDEIRDMANSGKTVLIKVPNLRMAGDTYYMLSNSFNSKKTTYSYFTFNFIGNGTRSIAGSTLETWNFKISVNEGDDEDPQGVIAGWDSGVYNIPLSGGPTREVLYEEDYEHARVWTGDNWSNPANYITFINGHKLDEYDEIEIISLSQEGDQPNVRRYDPVMRFKINDGDLVPHPSEGTRTKLDVCWSSRQSGQFRICDLTFSADLTKAFPPSSPEWYTIVMAIYGIKY